MQNVYENKTMNTLTYHLVTHKQQLLGFDNLAQQQKRVKDRVICKTFLA